MSRTLERTLSQHFGFSSFRPHQKEIVAAFLGGRDLFAALPTGGGKSLCYQLPALVRTGLTVVVSPLIALMKDQVDGARENGIAAVLLNSSLSEEDARAAWRQLYRGEARLLYVSPERLAREEFLQRLKELQVSAFAIDEAHCISEWGHEFRRDYRTLHRLRAEFPQVPIAAFTATATEEVQQDVVTQLQLREPLLVRGNFDRPELFYRVERKKKGIDQILEFVQRHPGEAGIVYRATRKATEETAGKLAAAGIAATAYHAGLPDARRAAAQDAFVRDQLQVVVATIAFGMGIDKSNVRWVVHGDLPRSIEGYYQESGRAGRDGDPAEVLLLWGPQDIMTQRFFIERIEDGELRSIAEAQLQQVLRYAEGAVCRRVVLLQHFQQKVDTRGGSGGGDGFDDSRKGCGGCDVCTGEVTLQDATVEARKILSAAVRTGQRFGGHHLVDIVTGTETDRVLELGHHRLPTFGVGMDWPRARWLALIRALEAAGHLQRATAVGGRHGGYSLTATGKAVLAGDVAVRLPVEGPDKPASSRRTVVETTEATALFQRLRELRKELARERGVPPYLVFSDRTLRDIAATRPMDRASLLECHGVGQAKLARYGEAFLKVLVSFPE